VRVTPARVAHAVLILVGLVVAVLALTVPPQISCRGVEMRPGDRCSKAGDPAVQTYETRLRTERQARPVIVVVGVLVTAFGAALLLSDVRRRRSPAAEHPAPH
jgi:hypothetical protein